MPAPSFADSPPGLFVMKLERCNGWDDDGDGLVDEGFPDLDGDGVADCVDHACTLVPVVPTPASSPGASCLYTDVSDPWLWDVQVEDAWTGSPEQGLSGATHGPVLAVQFDDDNGDGVIDELDALDLVVVDVGLTPDRADDRLAVITPGSWKVLYSVPASMAVGAVRTGAGGEPILVFGYGPPAASATHPFWQSPSQPLATGFEEVLSNVAAVVSDPSTRRLWLGVSGSALPLDGGSGETSAGAAPFLPTELVDLDRDGELEVLAAGGVWSLGGQELYLNPSVQAAGYSSPVVADFVPGGGLELLYLQGGTAWALDSGLAEIGATAIPVGGPGGACAAPNNVDGQADAVWYANGPLGSFVGYDWDKGVLWEVPALDATNGSACVAVDFNGDGLAEYVLADSVSVRIVRGDTGATLFEWTDYYSGTSWEHPLPVDLDADGSLELVVSSLAGLFVLGHPSDGWPAGAPAWPTTAFRAGDWGGDGTPTGAPAGGSLRAAPMEPEPSAGRPDLVPQIVEECTSGCASSSRSRVLVAVTNQGTARFEGTGTLDLYPSTEVLVLPLSSSPLSPHLVLEPGETWEGAIFAVPARSATEHNDYSISLVSLPDGEDRECDLQNNVIHWSAGDVCP